MRRRYFENWLISRLGFTKEKSEDIGMNTYVKYGGEIFGVKNDFTEVTTSKLFLHITFIEEDGERVNWRVQWSKSLMRKAESVEEVFEAFFKSTQEK